MKIAMVVTGGLHPSGVQQVVPSWLALFHELSQSHDIHAFVLRHLDRRQTYQLRGFTVHDLGRPSAPVGFTRRAQQSALQSAIDECGPFDLIHGFWADPAGQCAARVAARFGIPSVVTCDSGEFVSLPDINYGSQRTLRGRQAVREACTLATRVHVCTRFMAGLARAQGLDAVVIPLTSVDQAPAAVDHRSERHGDTFRLIQIASLSRVKNQRALIDAMPIVRQQINVHLDLVGEDTLDGELQQRASQIGIGEHVTFHGFQPQTRVHEFLSNADLYVQSSLHEAAGVSVLEAAAHGVAAAGTRAGYIADWSPTQAVAVENATAESLADTIVRLLADADRRRSIASRAQAFSIANDARSSAAQFDRLYLSLV